MKSTQGNRTRIAAALLAALFVFSQLHSFAHFSLVRHEVCPVDGELAHASHGHAPVDHVDDHIDTEEAHAPGHVHQEAVEHAAPLFEAPRPEEEGHGDHCLTVHLQDERRSHLISPASPLGPPPDVGGRVTADAREADRFGICALSLAPKQSPPALV